MCRKGVAKKKGFVILVLQKGQQKKGGPAEGPPQTCSPSSSCRMGSLEKKGLFPLEVGKDWGIKQKTDRDMKKKGEKKGKISGSLFGSLFLS